MNYYSSTDSCIVIFESSDMIKVGEDAVKDQPVTALEYSDEKQIRDYCALAYLYIYYGLPVRAEYTLRQIVKLRTENVLFGPGHAETIMYLKMLKTSLKMQHKYKSAMAVSTRISRAGKCFLSSFYNLLKNC